MLIEAVTGGRLWMSKIRPSWSSERYTVSPLDIVDLCESRGESPIRNWQNVGQVLCQRRTLIGLSGHSVARNGWIGWQAKCNCRATLAAWFQNSPTCRLRSEFHPTCRGSMSPQFAVCKRPVGIHVWACSWIQQSSLQRGAEIACTL